MEKHRCVESEGKIPVIKVIQEKETKHICRYCNKEIEGWNQEFE